MWGTNANPELVLCVGVREGLCAPLSMEDGEREPASERERGGRREAGKGGGGSKWQE